LLNRVNAHLADGNEVFVFNNRGAKAGASINHPHSQLVAAKSFPGTIHEQREAALEYFDEHGACYWCDMVQDELEDGSRVVYEGDHFVLLVPKASKWSYEMNLLPKRHLPNFVYINEEEIADLAKTLQAALHAYDELFDYPDRNFWMYTEKHEPFHWHMGFIPHIRVFGGIELGAGIWVVDKATPEDAAAQLKKAVDGYIV
jgi:UDPglucose--hexose-1-phosphate uridylyltransferase